MLPRRARLLAQQRPSSLGSEAAGSEGAQKQSGKLRRHELPYEALSDPARVPAQLSWRGTGADSIGPKDQATCGELHPPAPAGAARSTRIPT